jgi:hypothetical protein
MTHTLFARTVAAGLVVMAVGSARAQAGDENGAIEKVQLPQIAVNNPTTETLNHSAAEFRPLRPPAWPSQQYGVPSNRHNSRARQVWSGVALGLMGLIAGTSIGQTLDKNCGCHDPGMQEGMIGGPIGATVGATFGVWLGGR